MNFSSDHAFAFLGFIAGSTLGAAFILAVLPEPAQFGGSLITAGGTIIAATIGAMMIKHQLKENFANQKRLQTLQYLADPENRESIGRLVGIFFYFHLWASNKAPDITDDWIRQKSEEVRGLVAFVAPISVDLKTRLYGLSLTADKLLDGIADENEESEFIDETRSCVDEISKLVNIDYGPDYTDNL